MDVAGRPRCDHAPSSLPACGSLPRRPDPARRLPPPPQEISDGATALLTAGGMDGHGWANAWRALCWARPRNADKAHRLVVNNPRPSTGGSNGTAFDLFDIYRTEPVRGPFRIDAAFGAPAAVIEVLLYARPGHIELLPALPDAWAASGAPTGAPVRGGFAVDLRWRDDRPSPVRLHSTGGRTTTVTYGGLSRKVVLEPGASVTLKEFTR
ncbi:hypothetical protein GCM10010499_44470 [Streptomyces thermoviolaceus subsp. apingens]|nr:hypothetical protein GCM10010499_44470 [Streptomyces thermoviolaceus subsp. apingens]